MELIDKHSVAIEKQRVHWARWYFKVVIEECLEWEGEDKGIHHNHYVVFCATSKLCCAPIYSFGKKHSLQPILLCFFWLTILTLAFTVAHQKYDWLEEGLDYCQGVLWRCCVCCAARGHALVVCTLLVPLRSTSSSKLAPPSATLNQKNKTNLHFLNFLIKYEP